MDDKTDNIEGVCISHSREFVFALPDLTKMVFNIGHGF